MGPVATNKHRQPRALVSPGPVRWLSVVPDRSLPARIDWRSGVSVRWFGEEDEKKKYKRMKGSSWISAREKEKVGGSKLKTFGLLLLG